MQADVAKFARHVVKHVAKRLANLGLAFGSIGTDFCKYVFVLRYFEHLQSHLADILARGELGNNWQICWNFC